jgi:hypothetical protein
VITVGFAPFVSCVTVNVWPNAPLPVSCAKNSVPCPAPGPGSGAPGVWCTGAAVVNLNWYVSASARLDPPRAMWIS